MAAPYSGGVTSSQVGSYFVGQYYQVLQTTPDYAFQFYNESSTMVMVDGDSSQTASARMEIHTLLMSLNFTGIEIKTINSLESWDGGILVMVSGSLRTKDIHGKRKFVQSFFLARQENGYFVLNDIFQFIDEETVLQHLETIQPENKFESRVNAPITVPVPEQPVPEYGLEEEARDYMNSVHIEDDTVDKYSLPDQEQLQDHESETVVEETPLEEPSVSFQSAGYTSQDTWANSVEEPAGEPEKKTYASILRLSKGQPVSPVVTQTPFRKISPPASEWQETAEPSAQQSNIALSYVGETVGEAADEGLAQEEEEGEFKSVYVRNLPVTITAFDIEEEFKNFGMIRPDGVFIRSRKDMDLCYAFVEFEDILGVHNAIKASPIQLAGRKVYIEERRANSNNTSRGGRRGRGRGNYHTEATRGRFVAQGSGRGSNQNGSGYSRPRGNGFYQRSSRQGY